MSGFDFPKDFRKGDFEKILSFVTTGKFCQVLSVPGAGKATLLRLLATNKQLRQFHLGEKEPDAFFIYINLLEVADLDQNQIDKFLLHAIDTNAKPQSDPLLLTKQLTRAVGQKVAGNNKLILLFDHFDEFQNKLSRSFFQTLRNFKNLGKYNFAAVFATRRDLRELVDPQVRKDFYDFFLDNTLHLKIYDNHAVDLIFSQLEKVFEKEIKKEIKKQIVSLTNGHAKLTKAITELILREGIEPKKETLLSKNLIRATLFEIWLFLTAHEQTALRKIAEEKPVEQDDVLQNLLNFDLLKETQKPNNPTTRQPFSFTIPLFEDFVKAGIPKANDKIIYDQQTREITKGSNIISDLLSPQEHRLLKFLIENEGMIIERNEIISAVWPDAQVAEGISDEAIDQMVFRLRKKIEDEPNSPKHIITIKGLGLRFAP